MASTMTIDEVTENLEAMQRDPGLITEGSYSPAADDYPDNFMPFVQIHLAYLKKHRHVNPASYISNLRIMIKKR